MSLKKAVWPRDPSPLPTPSQNKMALANLIQGQDYHLPQRGHSDQMGRYQTFSASRDLDQRNELEHLSKKIFMNPSASRRSYSESRSDCYGSASTCSLTRGDSDIIPTGRAIRAGYPPKRNNDRDSTSFGTSRNGRHYCSYVCPNTGSPCNRWPDGYTTSYDLARHADAEHGLEEVCMIEEGVLSYERAQWVKSVKHHDDINRVREEMFCEACGFRFSSNRLDSKERHIKRGACLRRQGKQSSNGFDLSYATPKRKGDKTNPANTRR